ncbi:MAG: riboflavin synthase [Candidatus Omnitrophica bacterium]|nr:riboflavin synthase [Candidatus Omnitrophota bacterium]
MFTGLIRELGVVRNFNRSGNVYRLEASSDIIAKTAQIGDSVSINGACLTLVNKKSGVLEFDVMEETVRRTALSSVKSGDKVNMEDALRAGGPLGGHFVLGHVDCVGTIKHIESSGQEYIIEIEFPAEFSHLIVEKGSVTLDGISLTIGETARGGFKVYIIPHTMKMTNLSGKRARDKINIEFDIIGKYLARFRQLDKGGGVTEKFLKEMGF